MSATTPTAAAAVISSSLPSPSFSFSWRSYREPVLLFYSFRRGKETGRGDRQAASGGRGSASSSACGLAGAFPDLLPHPHSRDCPHAVILSPVPCFPRYAEVGCM